MRGVVVLVVVGGGGGLVGGGFDFFNVKLGQKSVDLKISHKRLPPLYVILVQQRG